MNGCQVSLFRSFLRWFRNLVIDPLSVVGFTLFGGSHRLLVSRQFHRLLDCRFGRSSVSLVQSCRFDSRNLSSRSRWIVGFRFSCAETRKVDFKCQFDRRLSNRAAGAHQLLIFATVANRLLNFTRGTTGQRYWCCKIHCFPVD